MKLPETWTKLTEARRSVLWNLAHNASAKYDLNQRNKQILLALTVEGLASHTLEINYFHAFATPFGRQLVAYVDGMVQKELGNQLWAWLQSGPGLKTRADF